jgi:hypothetical protein
MPERRLRRRSQHPRRASRRCLSQDISACSMHAATHGISSVGLMHERLSPPWEHSTQQTPGSLRHVPSRSRAAHRPQRARDSQASSLPGRLPGCEIAWRDCETAPIVASLPARPCIPRFGRLARLRRKPASVNPLTSATLRKTPRTNTSAMHNLAQAVLSIARTRAIADQHPRQILLNTSLIRCSRAISSA